MYLRTRLSLPNPPHEKSRTGAYPFSARETAVLRGLLHSSIETQDRINMLWRVRRRPHEQDGRECKKHNHNQHESRNQWMSAGEMCSTRRSRDHFVVVGRASTAALAGPWTNWRYMYKCVVGNESDGEMHGHQYSHRVGWLTPRQQPQVRDIESDRHDDSEPKEEPPRRGANPCHDRPRSTRNADPMTVSFA